MKKKWQISNYLIYLMQKDQTVQADLGNSRPPRALVSTDRLRSESSAAAEKIPTHRGFGDGTNQRSSSTLLMKSCNVSNADKHSQSQAASAALRQSRDRNPSVRSFILNENVLMDRRASERAYAEPPNLPGAPVSQSFLPAIVP